MCEHKRGDFIHGIWVCADCFSALDERPYRLGMVGFKQRRGDRQQIVWQASQATDQAGTPFRKFVAWMVGLVRARSLWTISKDEARQQCLEVLRDQGEPYGSDGACWARSDAKELVREGIFAYWDDAPSGANST